MLQIHRAAAAEAAPVYSKAAHGAAKRVRRHSRPFAAIGGDPGPGKSFTTQHGTPRVLRRERVRRVFVAMPLANPG